MNLLIKQIIIIGFTFLITVWLQYSDDKKYKNERLTFYEKFKLPLFFSALVCLILNIFDLLNEDDLQLSIKKKISNNDIYQQEIYIEPFLNSIKQ